jgi:hypothetical protein
LRLLHSVGAKHLKQRRRSLTQLLVWMQEVESLPLLLQKSPARLQRLLLLLLLLLPALMRRAPPTPARLTLVPRATSGAGVPGMEEGRAATIVGAQRGTRHPRPSGEAAGAGPGVHRPPRPGPTAPTRRPRRTGAADLPRLTTATGPTDAPRPTGRLQAVPGRTPTTTDRRRRMATAAPLLPATLALGDHLLPATLRARGGPRPPASTGEGPRHTLELTVDLCRRHEMPANLQTVAEVTSAGSSHVPARTRTPPDADPVLTQLKSVIEAVVDLEPRLTSPGREVAAAVATGREIA